jgi:hypothetical protein
VDVTDGIRASSGRENPREGRTDTRDAHVEIEGQAGAFIGKAFERRTTRARLTRRRVEAREAWKRWRVIFFTVFARFVW